MKIYLCGPCDTDNRTIMHKVANAIRKNIPTDSELYCPFELKIPNAWDMKQEQWAEKVFSADTAAIDAADYVIVISTGRISSAGTNWEQGYAYAKNKPVFVVQIGYTSTSLMTYCGSNRFFNCEDIRDAEQTLEFILQNCLIDYVPVHYFCSTVLT